MLWLNKMPQHKQLTSADEKIEISPEQILKNDLAKIEAHVAPKIVKSAIWQDVLKYEIPAQSLVNAQNSKNIFHVSNSAIEGIHSCLIKDYCGMQTRGDFDPYFDENNTPSHFLLERNLKLMKEALGHDSSLVSEVDWELIRILSESTSERISSAAMELLVNNQAVTDDKEESLIRISKYHTGEAKAKSLLLISKNATKRAKVLLANEIEETFEMADANTVISILENLKTMDLSTDQLARIIPKLCRFKDSNNWPMITYETKKINYNLQKDCEK